MRTATAIFCRPFFPRHAHSLSLFACLFLAGMLGAPRPAQAQDLPIQLPSPNAQSFGYFGSSVAGVGDLDGDGVPDLLVGASGEEVPSPTEDYSRGLAYAFSGQDGRLLLTFQSPDTSLYGRFGEVVAGVGDLDQDGIPDVLIGAPDKDRAYAFSGRNGRLLLELRSPDEDEDSIIFSLDVASAGDLDQDGVPDLLVGGRQTYVFSGRDGRLLLELPAFGSDVAGAGDLDQDGVPDLLVGGRQTYVFSGQGGELLLTLQSPAEEPSDDFFGSDVAGAGDLDQDGVPDVLIGAPGQNRAYAFSGQDGQLLHELRSDKGGSFGAEVTGPGDLDGDGTPDLVVGAPTESIFYAIDGAAYAFSGRDGRLLREFLPFDQSEHFGGALASVGDLNGDGIPDLVVGAAGENAQVFSGGAYVFSGKPDTTPPVCTDPAPIRENGQIVGVEVTASDPESGIDQILFTTLTNNRAFVNDFDTAYEEGDSLTSFLIPFFPFEDVLVRAERIEPGVPAQLVFEVTNRIGLSATCDPVFLTVEGSTPAPFALQAPYPNPARATATFAFALEEAGRVALEVFDAAGRRVAVLLQEEALAVGTYEAAWDGRDEGGRVLASGVYFARLRQGARVSTQAVTLLR